jgi:hypothetical protein
MSSRIRSVSMEVDLPCWVGGRGGSTARSPSAVAAGGTVGAELGTEDGGERLCAGSLCGLVRWTEWFWNGFVGHGRWW